MSNWALIWVLWPCVECVLSKNSSIVAILAAPVNVVVMAPVAIFVDRFSTDVGQLPNRSIALDVNIVVSSESSFSISLVSNKHVVVLSTWTIFVANS